jgi:GH15 family glucan-1,4-alpha-glucosidase
VRLVIRYVSPQLIDEGELSPNDPRQVDDRLQMTIRWWRSWCKSVDYAGPDRVAVLRSALVLKALQNAPTGAIAAAATTSLPERIGGPRNWDYRFSWIRDSFLSVRSLAFIGFTREADGFRRFIQRSSAGSAHDLQIMYGVGGERRLTEIELPYLEGYRSSAPVRIGNGASEQLQLDAYGELLQLSWNWHQRGHSPDDDYWRFLSDLVDVACERWKDPDRGIWEVRGEPRHFVHSKVMCWTAVDRGIALAEGSLRRAPLQRWKRTAREMLESIHEHGVDPDRGCFVQSYGSKALDSSLLLIPGTGFCAYGDPCMVRTVDAIREDLQEDGLLLRYRTESADDGLGQDREGFFLSCTFWLAECLAGQGRHQEAREAFDRAAATSNDLGLFSEEFEPRTGELLGNFPQGLTHLSHIGAAVRLAATQGP